MNASPPAPLDARERGHDDVGELLSTVIPASERESKGAGGNDTLCISRCARSDSWEVNPRPPRILTTASHNSYTSLGLSKLALRALIH